MNKMAVVSYACTLVFLLVGLVSILSGPVDGGFGHLLTSLDLIALGIYMLSNTCAAIERHTHHSPQLAPDRLGDYRKPRLARRTRWPHRIPPTSRWALPSGRRSAIIHTFRRARPGYMHGPDHSVLMVGCPGWRVCACDE
eukprot:COSAG02_NODE_330_length_24501_cov_39.465850_23_plen_140_part_00